MKNINVFSSAVASSILFFAISIQAHASCANINEGSAANIICPSGQTVSTIRFASYGTPTGSCGSYATSSCNAPSSRSVVSNACLGKSSCTVPASNSMFGGDPCSGTAKTLRLEYSCSIPSTSASACGRVAEGQRLNLACPSGQTISKIVFASYGNATGSCGYFATSSCNASASTSLVSAACLGKANCSVLAVNDIFGDPCRGTAKSLAVQVQCSGSTSQVAADCPSGASCYYVSSSTGNDSTGTGSISSPWKTLSKINERAFSPGTYVLLKRGDIWRERLYPTSGSSTGYITYGAYGTGKKPQIMGSLERNSTADWVSEGANIWVSKSISKDVGNIIFNNDQSVGRKYWDFSDVTQQGDFWYDPVNKQVKLYSTSNPASIYSDIELALDGMNADLSNKSYIIIKDLWFRNGDYGIFGQAPHHITIKNNDFSYLGGAILAPRLRAGNGIEFWESASDILVEGNKLWEIYDAALTHQGAKGTTQKNIIYRYNLIWNVEYCFEFFSEDSAATVDGIEFSNNTCVDSGYGWSHAQRPDPSGRHVLFWDYLVSGKTVVKNNIFSRARGQPLYIPPGGNISLSRNLWQQASTSTMVRMPSTIYSTQDFPRFKSDTGYSATDFVSNPLFVNPAIRDYAPAIGSPACTASTTGSYIGALPCK